MRLYLVTGFLGAGKTTFLKNFLSLFSQEKVALVINEFGREGVDGTLLSDLKIELSEVNNGSIFCACRLDKFEEVLEDMLRRAPDCVIVEASGLSDPTNIREILSGNDKFSTIKYAGSICLVDFTTFPKVLHTAVVCRKQLAVSDVVVLNKADLASNEQKQAVRDLVSAQRPGVPMYETSFGRIPAQVAGELLALRPEEKKNGAETLGIQDITLKKHLVKIREGFPKASLQKFLKMIVLDTYRIKGFVRLEKQVLLVDCVQNMVQLIPFEGTVEEEKLQKLVILSGKGMAIGKTLREAAAWYPQDVDILE